MSVLIVSSTQAECAPVIKSMSDIKQLSPYLYSGLLQGSAVDVLIVGIGSVSTTFRLTQTLLQHNYTRVVSIGIAGSFDEDIKNCDIVQITHDCFADLGIDDNGVFRSLREAGLPCDDLDSELIVNPSPAITPYRQVRGITVQTTSGSEPRIADLKKRYNPQVETMENAAFFYVCLEMNIPFASFRAISNKVEPRNKENWQIAEAIANLSLTFLFA